MSNPLLREVVPEINANPVSFHGRVAWTGQELDCQAFP